MLGLRTPHVGDLEWVRKGREHANGPQLVDRIPGILDELRQQEVLKCEQGRVWMKGSLRASLR